MTAQPLLRTELTGTGVRLEPLADEHLPMLFQALVRPEIFASGWGGGPAALTPERASDVDAFAEWFLSYVPQRSGLTYVVIAISGEWAGQVVGSTSFGYVDAGQESLHLGWTAYRPEVWGTRVNPETKLLQLGHVFDLGYGRVQLQADAANERSRAAILRLGATFEGVLRRAQQRADGTWRDTAVYSVLAPEWPDVRAGLEQRLAG